MPWAEPAAPPRATRSGSGPRRSALPARAPGGRRRARRRDRRRGCRGGRSAPKKAAPGVVGLHLRRRSPRACRAPRPRASARPRGRAARAAAPGSATSPPPAASRARPRTPRRAPRPPPPPAHGPPPAPARPARRAAPRRSPQAPPAARTGGRGRIRSCIEHMFASRLRRVASRLNQALALLRAPTGRRCPRAPRAPRSTTTWRLACDAGRASPVQVSVQPPSRPSRSAGRASGTSRSPPTSRRACS